MYFPAGACSFSWTARQRFCAIKRIASVGQAHHGPSGGFTPSTSNTSYVIATAYHRSIHSQVEYKAFCAERLHSSPMQLRAGRTWS